MYTNGFKTLITGNSEMAPYLCCWFQSTTGNSETAKSALPYKMSSIFERSRTSYMDSLISLFCCSL